MDLRKGQDAVRSVHARIAVWALVALSVVLLAQSATASAATHVAGGTFASDVTWNAAGSPYVLDGNVTVGASTTLTVEAGTVIKLNGSGRSLAVNGRLVARGTAANRIVFTSIKDDSAGGDTAGDGPTSGAPGDWYRIQVQVGASADLRFVTIRYGSAGNYPYTYQSGALQVTGGTLTADQLLLANNRNAGLFLSGGTGNVPKATISDSVITDNGAGISSSNAVVELYNSRIRKSSDRGIYMYAGSGYAGDPSLLYDTDITRSGGFGIYLFIDRYLATSLWPRGSRNNIFANSLSNGSPLQMAMYNTRTDSDWSGNYWADGVTLANQDSVCNPKRHLIYPGSASDGPGPVTYTSGNTFKPPSTWVRCAQDGLSTVPFAAAYLARPGGPLPSTDPDWNVDWPGVPASQMYGSCGGGYHAFNPSACLSDPVNSATGSFSYQHTDLSLAGVGVPFSLTRSYNSADDTAGLFGRGWRTNWEVGLVVKPGGDVTLIGEDGQRVEYDQKLDGSYVAAVGGRSVLSKTSDGYELVSHDQVHYRFDNAGRLVIEKDRNGNGVTVQRDASNRIASVTDFADRSVAFSYDGQGRLSEVRLPDDRHVSYSYTGSGTLLTGVKDTTGGDWVYDYDSTNRLSSEKNPNLDFTFRNTYASDGRVQSQLDALGKETDFAWDAATSTTTTTDARGKTWKDVYDNKNRLVTRIDPLGHDTTWSYDDNLNPDSQTDARHNKTVMTYDERGNMLSRTAPAPLSYDEHYTYNERNDPLTKIDRRGHTTTYDYDAAGNLKTVTLPGSRVIRYDHDPSTGLLRSTTDATNRTTAYARDTSTGAITSITHPSGGVESLTYDSSGRVKSIVDPRGNAPGADPDQYRTTFNYADDDQLQAVTDPLGHSTVYAYDPGGRLETITDPNSHVTRYAYWPTDALKSITGGDGAKTSYDYDQVGNLEKITDPNNEVDPGNHVTTFTYDDANRLIERDLPGDNHTWTYVYDETGDLTEVHDANGNATPSDPDDGITTFRYDELNRLTKIDYSDATPDVTYAYDENSNVTSMTDTATTGYSYDLLDRLQTVTRNGDEFSYDYDDAGRITRRGYPSGQDTTYTYDPGGRLHDATFGTVTTTYGYDDADNLTSTTLPGAGHSETRAYDRAGRLTDITDEVAAPGTPASQVLFQYEYDPAGNPQLVSEPSGETQFRHDASDRLTDTCYSAGICNSATADLHYTYDGVGNRTSEQRPVGWTATYAYDAADQLESKTVGPSDITTYDYDHNGNVTRAGSRTWAYDLANRPVTTTLAGETTTYAYDGAGNRLSATAGGATSTFGWDVNHPDAQLASQAGAEGTQSYWYGLGRIGLDHSGTKSFYRYDGFANVTGVDDALGQPQWRYSYDPFGIQRSATQLDPGAPVNPMRFAGEYQDPTGLYNLRARLYDPADGRFTATDPLAHSPTAPATSAYQYADDQPTTLIDPSGEGAVWSHGFCLLCVAKDVVIGDPRHNPLDLAALLPVGRALKLARLGEDALRAAKVPEHIGPGPFARESIPAHPGRPTAEEQREINDLMAKHGCHRCGTNDPGTTSGNAIGDHQPPEALDDPVEYYPHCITCARQQGGYVATEKRRRAGG